MKKKNVFSTILKFWTETSLVLRILIGLSIGVILGLFVPGWTFVGLLGKIFVSALKAIAPLLVMILVASSISKAEKGLGPRFRVVISEYMLNTFFAAFCAVLGSFLFPVTLDLKDAATATTPGTLSDVFVNLFTNMVANPVESIAEANYIGILFWSVIIGIGLKHKASHSTIEVIGDIANVVTEAVRWIIQCAPFGIMGLVFVAVSENGLDIFTTYGQLLLLLAGCMLFSTLVFNPLLAFLLTKENPYPLLFKCLEVSGIHAFFTRSSAANIPINMGLCKDLNLDKDFYSVSIPLGATINMNGAAITITVMTLAMVNTLGIHVTFMSAIFLCVITTLAACGSSGVTGGSLLLIPMACSFFGIGNDVAMQAVSIGFIIGVIQDSIETALNSSADVFFTATAERYEKKKKNKIQK
jgi:serine/threonine transporter